MLSSRRSISNANNNFEYLKNNIIQPSSIKPITIKTNLKTSRISSTTRGSVLEENNRNHAASGNYKTNFSGVNKNSNVVRTSRKPGENNSLFKNMSRCGSNTSLKLKMAAQNQQFMTQRNSINRDDSTKMHGLNAKHVVSKLINSSSLKNFATIGGGTVESRSQMKSRNNNIQTVKLSGNDIVGKQVWCTTSKHIEPQYEQAGMAASQSVS